MRRVSVPVPHLETVRSWTLTIGGLGSISAGIGAGAAWWAGVIAGGVSLLVLEFLGRPEPGTHRAGRR